MKNFCIYNGKKIAKLETWNITSIELSGDYASVIIQAESKSNKSEYTLDITPLISNQYENGIDPYSATIINELTGVDNWIIDNVNKTIRYIPNTPDINAVASTLAQRYSRSPSDFVGVNSFRSIIESTGWNIDEGGQITKEDIQPIVLDQNTSPYVYHTSDSQGEKVIVYDINAYCSSVTPQLYDDGSRVITYTFDPSSTVYPSNGCLFKRYFDGVLSPPNTVKQFQRYSNPYYQTPPDNTPVPVSDSELQTALKNTLESNNPALASAIAGAITAAYTYDVIGFNELYNLANIKYQQVTNEITSRAESGNVDAQQAIVSNFNNITEDILTSDYSEFFEVNKQPK